MGRRLRITLTSSRVIAASLWFAACATSTPDEPNSEASKKVGAAVGAPTTTSARIDGPPGELEVRTLPRRAVARSGDESLGETPVTIDVAADASKSLHFEATGYAPCSVEVTPSPGVVKRRTIVLVPTVDHPEWVTIGSHALAGDPPKIVGVGEASGIRNLRLAEAAASNHARAEVQILFTTFTSHLMKRYSATLPEPTAAPEPVDETPSVSSGVRSFVSSTLNTVKIVDVWRYPGANAVYAKAELDLTAFIKSLDAQPDLPDDLKERIRAHFAAAVEDTAQELPSICR